MNCFFCRAEAGKADKDVKAVLCGNCVQRLCGAPEPSVTAPKLSFEERKARKTARAEKKVAKLEQLKTAKRGRGRGWHLKKLFEADGQYFSMGKEINALEANKLRKALAKTEAIDPFKIAPAKRGRPRKVTK